MSLLLTKFNAVYYGTHVLDGANETRLPKVRIIKYTGTASKLTNFFKISAPGVEYLYLNPIRVEPKRAIRRF
jgi:hypothetical protein